MVLASHVKLLEFASVSLTPSTHPNEMNFRGVLVRLDEPSDKAPNGSDGHRIMVPASVAKRRLRTLVNMGLNYAPGKLTAHAQRHKVGTIKRAWIDGQDLWVEGVIWKHDFPEAEKDLKKPGLGMSMELGDVSVEDQSAKVWKLNDFMFLGATILYKRSAAYHKTSAIAAQAEKRSSNMKVKDKKKTAATSSGSDNKVVELAASAAANAVVEKLQPTLTGMARQLSGFQARLDEMDIRSLAAAGTVPAEEEEEDTDLVAAGEEGDEEDTEIAAGKKDEEDDEDEDDDEDEMDSAVDKGSQADMGPDTEDDADGDDTPGKLGNGARNKGSKTTSENKVGKHVSEGVTGSAYKRMVKVSKELAAENATLKGRLAKLEKTMKAQGKQIKAASDLQSRRSLEIVAATDEVLDRVLSKSGTSASEIRASGDKLSIDQVDAVLAAGMPGASVVDRMAFKNRLTQADLMEHGGVTR